ncbi:addiction module protein [Lentilactobacillus fungorum]|uniref:Endoribonuclease YoeB n=1 Tax=Lentilactobacillus fungorum TaxID=2201250 RepID=A0ABQ3VY51_9LACO|nr:Txe/YoeB family addiction module toxin [Lentilactobacillus fungorum]GHP13371.1 addiction module protein [Lentilactobacillus fungorum]
MNKWQLKIKSTAKGDLKKVLKRPLRPSFERIKATLAIDPFSPTQSFEKLTPPAASFYSRRINGQHRVVYTIDKDNKVVTIYSCWAHYESGFLDMSGKSSARKD